MSLRTKVILTWITTTIVLFAVLYVALSRILFGQFLQLEARNTLNHVQRARQALDNELNALVTTTTDWAQWDDSYTFMQTGSQEFVDANLLPETMETLRLDALLYLTPDGGVFSAHAFDLQTRQPISLPASLSAEIPALHRLSIARPEGAISGLLMTAEGPLLFALQPILTSHGQGPPTGALLMARFLDAAQAERLSDLVHISVALLPIGQADPSLPAATLSAMLKEPGAAFVAPLDDQTVNGYVALGDVFGRPGLLLRVSSDRAIYQATLAAVRLIGLALLLIGVVFGWLAVRLLDQTFLRRVTRLAAGVRAIGANSAGLALRADETGSDELAELTRAISAMLGRLAASHQAQLDSEARYRAIVEQSSEGILLMELQTRAISEANLRACELLGYTQAEITGVTLYDLVALEPSVIDANLEVLLLSGHFHVVERLYRRRDGSLLPVEVTATVLHLQNRQVISILLHDISERKRMELAAREQQTLTEALRDTAAALSSTLDFEELLDRILDNVGEVLPHETSEIMLIDDRIAHIARVRGYKTPAEETLVLSVRFRAEETPNLRHMLHTGQPLAIPDTHAFPGWVILPETAWLRSFAGAPIRRRGAIIGFVTVGSARPDFYQQSHAERLQAFADQAGVAIENAHLYEISRQEAARAETLLRLAQRLLSQLSVTGALSTVAEESARVFDAPAAAVFLLDARHESLTLTASCGLPDAYVQRMRLAPVTDYGPLATAPRFPLLLTDLSALPNAALNADYGFRSAVALLMQREEQLLGVVVVFFSTSIDRISDDQTALAQGIANQATLALMAARLHETIQRHAAEMEDRVAERTAALLEANVKLQELDIMKSQFVSNVSHELRTPLANIKLYLSLLESGKPERRSQYMTTLHREANLLHRLIEDLLQLSRLDLGRTTPVLAPVEVNQVLATLAQDREPLINERGLALQLALDAAPLWAQADHRLLIQMLTTLMTNAANYTPTGGAITLRSFPRLAAGAAWVCVAVSDTGPGIPLEEQPQVFNRFFRGQAGLRSNAPGAGLGLAICQEIVQLHGGQITLESQVGQGSTFTVMLKPAPAP